MGSTSTRRWPSNSSKRFARKGKSSSAGLNSACAMRRSRPDALAHHETAANTTVTPMSWLHEYQASVGARAAGNEEDGMGNVDDERFGSKRRD
ncbi:Uncharacterised protein [Achromobacter denitrificans]|nr:Uncharacterised protein [Achromobacter denitrificans]